MEFHLLRYNSVKFAENQPTYKKTAWNKHSRLAGFLLGIFFHPEDGGDMFLRNVGCFSAGSKAGSIHNHSCENFRSYMILTDITLHVGPRSVHAPEVWDRLLNTCPYVNNQAVINPEHSTPLKSRFAIWHDPEPSPQTSSQQFYRPTSLVFTFTTFRSDFPLLIASLGGTNLVLKIPTQA
jgi:hypothetical protein